MNESGAQVCYVETKRKPKDETSINLQITVFLLLADVTSL
jgi:hypothetical protein